MDSSPAKTVSLFRQPYLDRFNQCYKNIVTLNLQPQGPLGTFVRRVQFPRLSEFQQPGQCSRPYKPCGFALASMENCNKDDLMTVDEVPNLISFLVSNGYTIDTSVTKMLNSSDIRFDNKLICFVTYQGYTF